MADDLRTALCRDCGTDAGTAVRCKTCHSTRIIRHQELHHLHIAHIDCDAFYASIEKRDHPEFYDQPVIIGGRKRGVVAAACYVARLYGIRSAMPMFQALKKCPHAVVLPPDMAKYSAVGRLIRNMMHNVTPLVEPVSIDEAFLDLSIAPLPTDLSPAERLIAFAKAVEDNLNLTVSVGLSYNKFLAKMASDLDKPRGFAIIGKEEAARFLSDKPVGLIWGVGKVLQRRLAADGIHLIGQLAEEDPAELARRYGSIGPRLHQFAQGQDHRNINTEQLYRSISVETTLPSDIASLEPLAATLQSLCTKLEARLRRAGYGAEGVAIKLKTADFRLTTRHRRLPNPSVQADRLFETALPLLQGLVKGDSFRLIGIGADGLVPLEEADRPDLLT